MPHRSHGFGADSIVENVASHLSAPHLSLMMLRCCRWLSLFFMFPSLEMQSSGGGQYASGPGGQPPQRKRRVEDDFTPKKKVTGQRPVDFFSSAIHHVKTRHYHKNTPFSYHVPPHAYYCKDLLPARVTVDNPSTALCTQWVSTTVHPQATARVTFTAVEWSPSGRRLLCATSRGEFIVLNGHSFATEIKTMGHAGDKCCKAATWGRVSGNILTADDGGTVKVWVSKSTLVGVAEFNSGHGCVNDLCYAPGEMKFATCGRDGSARIWDTDRAGGADVGGDLEEELKFEGHGSEVTTVHWHPFKALLVTGSGDAMTKLWDPRAGHGCIATLSSHSEPVTTVRWNQNGYEFITASKDGTVKLWDVRQVKESTSYAAHSKDVMSVAWHPSHSGLFASCGRDGSIHHWVRTPLEGQRGAGGVREVVRPTASIQFAHDRFKETVNPVNKIAWSPMGHLLASCSGDVKFWHRNKPGATEEASKGLELDELDVIQ